MPRKEKVQVQINPGNPAVGRMIVQLGFPKAAQIMTIKRDEKYIIPVGSTQVKANDKLFILAEDKNTVQFVYDSLAPGSSHVLTTRVITGLATI